jgi:hypothetical protein
LVAKTASAVATPLFTACFTGTQAGAASGHRAPRKIDMTSLLDR